MDDHEIEPILTAMERRIARSNRFSAHTGRIAAVRFLILTVSPVAAEYAMLFFIVRRMMCA